MKARRVISVQVEDGRWVLAQFSIRPRLDGKAGTVQFYAAQGSGYFPTAESACEAADELEATLLESFGELTLEGL